MHSIAHFHEQQRGYGCGTYGDVGDRSNDYVVTRDGEVYSWRYNLFGLSSGRLYSLKYSAVSKEETNWVTAPTFEGEQATAIDAKIVGSWNDYGTARQYADRVIENRRKGGPLPGSPADTPAGGGSGGGTTSGGNRGLIALGLLGGAGLLAAVLYRMKKKE